MALQVVRDQQIAGTATREELGAADREPPVVHEPGSLRRLHGLATTRRAESLAGQPSLERGGGVVARSERA